MLITDSSGLQTFVALWLFPLQHCLKVEFPISEGQNSQQSSTGQGHIFICTKQQVPLLVLLIWTKLWPPSSESPPVYQLQNQSVGTLPLSLSDWQHDNRTSADMPTARQLQVSFLAGGEGAFWQPRQPALQSSLCAESWSFHSSNDQEEEEEESISEDTYS